MISIIDAFENLVGVQLNAKNAQALQKMGDDEVERLANGCLEFMSQFLNSFETSISRSDDDPSRAYLDSYYTDLVQIVGDLVTVTTRLDLISRFLLYYPSIAINDSFLIKNWDILGLREYLSRYFNDLATLAPLVRDGVVRLVPRLPAKYDDRVNELALSVSTELRKKYQKRRFGDASLNHFSREFVLSSYFDSYVPYPYLHPLFRTVLSRAGSVKDESDISVVAKTLPKLQLPKLGNLTVKDILAIRESDEAFARWRSHLQQVILRLRLLQVSGKKISANDFQELARIELIEEAIRLRESAKSTRSIRYVKDSFVGVGITVVSSFASSGILQTDWKKLVASGAAGLFYSLVFKRSSKTDKALLKHYALFEGLEQDKTRKTRRMKTQ